MAFVSSGHSSLEMTCGRPLCPRCRAPMWALRVEPKTTAEDDRTFKCPRCEHSQNVAFPKNRNWCNVAKMSALGQKQTCAPQVVMSALPPKADMCSAPAHVRYGPIADILLQSALISLSTSVAITSLIFHPPSL